MEPVTGWAAPNDFEVKKIQIYAKALEFDEISPDTHPDLIFFTEQNPYAEAYRKMLH